MILFNVLIVNNMMCLKLLVAFFAILNCGIADDYVINNKKFPEDFWFGVATSAYQVEGGWNADGKGLSNWDERAHQIPSVIVDGSTGDVACDSYHKFETDLEMLKNLGVKHYRFSISWSRVLPTGYADVINPQGVKYYKNMIKLLKANNIIPLVTIYHFDMPLNFHNFGGFLNDSFIEWFADYSRVCFEQFGNDVQYWTTFNEALGFCAFGRTGNEYQCGHNVIRAHAAAWHVYDKEFKGKQGGKISIVHAIGWWGPASDSSEDVEASERKMQFDLGWFGNPIYYGDYPDVMKERVGDRLPKFTDEEKVLLKGTNDYFCINSYASNLVQDNSSTIVPNPTRDDDIGVIVSNNDNYPDGAWGIKPLTKWIQSKYNDPEIIITENGLGVDQDHDSMEDDNRITLVRNYLSGLRDAIDDGVKIFGYTLWSVMDNFEWNSGYTMKFGIYRVDFNDPNRTRTPKKSAEFYKNVIKTKCLVDECTE